jgi:hypothetical protein
MNAHFILALLLVSVVLFLLLRMERQEKEGFLNIGAPDLKDLAGLTRDQFVELGQKRYNRFADPMDAFRPGLAGSNPTLQTYNEMNQRIKKAITSADLQTANPSDEDSKTGLLYKSTQVRESIPPESSVLREARKCEAQKGRDRCDILGKEEYKNCGICIKEGTDVDEKFPKTHIGGLLVLPMDREMAEQEGIDKRKDPMYVATIGSCPPGFLFVDREKCEKAANRQNCKEIGDTGGFDGGKTIEGRRIQTPQVTDGVPCAACPTAGPTTYLYENPTDARNGKRNYKVRLRAATPFGTGLNIIQVIGVDSNGTKYIMARQSAVGGKEMVLDLIGNVYEGLALDVLVFQEFPHRPSGKEEVFQADLHGIEISSNTERASKVDKGFGNHFPGNYGFTRDTGRLFCESIGTKMATKEDVQRSFNDGAQLCSWGHVTEGPVLLQSQGYHTKGWCSSGGSVNAWNDNQGYAGVWCKGIKPPTGYYQNDMFKTFKYIMPFFASYGEWSIPSQIDQPNIKSQHGETYEAPYYRGVCLQWEMISNATISLRRVAVESTILTVEGQNPSTVSADGQKMFRVLRRYGTFNRSKLIATPKPQQLPSIIPNQYWIWNSQKKNQVLRMTIQVPGILDHPQYLEDIPFCPRGPLIKEKSTFGALTVSPCLKEGQEAGSYSLECLKALFAGVGGDIYNGKLSPLMSTQNINKLLFTANKEPRDQDDISQMLANMYSIASTGRTLEGAMVGEGNPKKRREIINDAGQALFGIDIVSPCEEVAEDANGEVMLVQKQAPFDAECMDYLYTNAGLDDLFSSPLNKKTTLGATYTYIGDRFSGLRQSEKDKDKEKHPFMACQRSGTMAPIDGNGKINSKVVNMLNARAMAKDGSLKTVQEELNKVYQTANMSLDGDLDVSREVIAAQQEAVRQCYGIDKALNVRQRTGCGIMARYVRVLRSQSGVGTKGFGQVSIQIPQLQVFDAMGTEIAKGKQTSAQGTYHDIPACVPSVAVNGDAFPKAFPHMYHDQDTMDGSQQFWMVDLGDVVEVRKIVYYNRTDCCFQRAMDMPVQLLDADKNVVAQRLLSEAAVTGLKETIEFTKDDAIIPVPIANIVPGMRIRFLTAVMKNGYMAMLPNGMATFIKMNTGSGDARFPLTEFMVRKGLNGIAGSLSFESVQKPGTYLGVLEGSQNVWIVSSNVTRYKFFSWAIRPALNKAPSMVSLESWGMPGLFAKTLPGAAEAVITQRMAGETSPYTLLGACFQIVRA